MLLSSLRGTIKHFGVVSLLALQMMVAEEKSGLMWYIVLGSSIACACE
jgi:hypothetical protein